MADFELAVAKTIANEGGDKYTDRKNDRGGPTKYGISLKFLQNNRDFIIQFNRVNGVYLNIDSKYIENLTLEKAKSIYKKYFIQKILLGC